MKTLKSAAMFSVLSAMLITGCAGIQRPPSDIEQRLFNVETQIVQQVEWKTNVVSVTNLDTAGVPVVVSTPVSQPVTNYTETYILTPNETAKAAQETAQAVGDLFGPYGALAGSAVGGLLALWAAFRSRKKGQMAANLVQAVETARSIILQSPKGAELDREFTAWLVKHQAEGKVLAEVSALVSKVADDPKSNAVAEAIMALVDK